MKLKKTFDKFNRKQSDTFENTRQKISLTLTATLNLKTLLTKQMTLLRTNSEKFCKEEECEVKGLINDALNC